MNRDQARKGNGRFAEDKSGKTAVPTPQSRATVTNVKPETIVISNTPNKMIYISPSGEVLAQLYKDGKTEGTPLVLSRSEVRRIMLSQKALLESQIEP